MKRTTIAIALGSALASGAAFAAQTNTGIMPTNCAGDNSTGDATSAYGLLTVNRLGGANAGPACTGALGCGTRVAARDQTGVTVDLSVASYGGDAGDLTPLPVTDRVVVCLDNGESFTVETEELCAAGVAGIRFVITDVARGGGGVICNAGDRSAGEYTDLGVINGNASVGGTSSGGN